MIRTYPVTRRGLALPLISLTLAVWQPHVASAQVLQLPTIGRFSTTTTVVVPDRGSVLAGGVSRSAHGFRRVGTPLFPRTSRALGRSLGSSQVRVHATIHDLEAMDAQRLAQWKSLRTASAPRQRAKPAALAKLSQVRRAVAQQKQTSAEQFQRHLAAARKWEARGQWALAASYYRSALARADATQDTASIRARLAEVQLARSQPKPQKVTR